MRQDLSLLDAKHTACASTLLKQQNLCILLQPWPTMHAGIGDVNMAYQAFGVATAMDSTHAEALTNLGVLEVRQGNDNSALVHFQAAQKIAPLAYEAWYNGALVSMRAGNLQECYSQATTALAAFPDHSDTQDLLKQLQLQFNAL